MADCLLLFNDGRVLLSIGWSHHPFAVRHVSYATDLKKLPSHIQVQLLTGNSVELYESEFNFLVTRRLSNGFPVVVSGITFEKHLVNVLSTFFGDIQESVFSRRSVIRDSSFVEMANIVEFMAMDNEAVGSVSHHVLRFTNSGRVRRVKVPIFMLSSLNQFGKFVQRCFKFRVGSKL